MCFSATASFTACAVLTATGSFSVRRARELNAGPGLMALSTFPLFFGIQQGFEGLVWLGINEVISPFWRDLAGVGFVLFAFLFWPIAGPVTGYLIEQNSIRKKIFLSLIPCGVGVGLYLAYFILTVFAPPIAPDHWDGHVAYLYEAELINNIEYIYFITACAALILSSHRVAFMMGAALTGSFAFTMYGYQLVSLPSVWCFFAAICSIIIVIELYRLRPGGPGTIIETV